LEWVQFVAVDGVVDEQCIGKMALVVLGQTSISDLV
jgi:hypothetical protein